MNQVPSEQYEEVLKSAGEAVGTMLTSEYPYQREIAVRLREALMNMIENTQFSIPKSN